MQRPLLTTPSSSVFPHPNGRPKVTQLRELKGLSLQSGCSPELTPSHGASCAHGHGPGAHPGSPWNAGAFPHRTSISESGPAEQGPGRGHEPEGGADEEADSRWYLRQRTTALSRTHGADRATSFPAVITPYKALIEEKKSPMYLANM